MGMFENKINVYRLGRQNSDSTKEHKESHQAIKGSISSGISGTSRLLYRMNKSIA
jgi:hypothetical protein